MQDDKTPPNPIRRLVISPQIFMIIKGSLMDPEIEELPTDYLRGLDFKITKSQKGGYADYSTSGWARKESALSQAEMDAIESNGLFTLREYLPKKPSDSEVRIIREMFEASIDSRPYDPDRWAAYYKPWGLQTTGSGSRDEGEGESVRSPAPTAPAPAPVAARQVTQESSDSTPPWDEPAPARETKPAAGGDKAQDILAMIRSRQQKA
jgi:hypothetical protein